MTIDRALHVDAVVASFHTYEVATDERGWSPDDVERWWLSTLTELLLARRHPRHAAAARCAVFLPPRASRAATISDAGRRTADASP